MSSKSYTIPKALQKDVQFFGLKAKYVDRAFKGIFLALALGLFLGAFTSTILGFFLSILVVSGYLGLMLFYSNAYGENGYIKLKANRQRPEYIKGKVNKKNLVV